jgi:CheY-like chemotaxis protein
MIIVVEDDDSVRAITEDLLLDRGYDVITARNGTEGLSRIQREPCLSLLVTDIRMPGIDGWEVARRATAIIPRLKVLYMTGYSSEDRPDDAPLGPVLRKPWHMHEMLRCIERLLGAS